jgi:hypothetical protein
MLCHKRISDYEILILKFKSPKIHTTIVNLQILILLYPHIDANFFKIEFTIIVMPLIRQYKYLSNII